MLYIRLIWDMMAILYAPVTEDVLSVFKIENMALPTGKVNNASVLIKKRSKISNFKYIFLRLLYGVI